MKKNQWGFTLIELMIVISIITILTTMALPSFQDRAIRVQVTEAFNLAQMAQDGVADHYREKGTFPADNLAAGLPAAEKIRGNYVTAVQVTAGAIQVTLGNRVNKHVVGQLITIRPAIVEDEPRVPIAWVYGYASVPTGMVVVGENKSTILAQHLPVNSRY